MRQQTSTPPPSLEALRALDDALAERGLDPAVDGRLQRRLFADPAERRRRAPWAPLAAALAAVAALALGVLWISRPSPPSDPAARLGFARASGDVQVQERSLRCVYGPCALRDTRQAVALSLDTGAQLSRTSGGLAQGRGTVRYAVRRRPPLAPPLVIAVSHGSIEVLGTRFVVEQRRHGGSVRLEHGRIRFVSTRGERRLLTRPGATLSWPLPKPHPPGPSARRDDQRAKKRSAGESGAARKHKAPSGPSARKDTLGRVLARAAQLRALGQYERAARLLRQRLKVELRAGRRPAALEQLSFELGALLGDHLGQRRRACEHLQAHQRRFRRGRYGREVRSMTRRLRCAR